ncbi:receptor-like protein EIX1 [Heracleum sosnowskyi]|uniref:Receptor-like protein EIX1 n=1 Tax=Heracleum sosnowskyi TaxID=360622 RepID=A0AAD8M9C0_9APIA|nr:receptor-like protein EIX1 [Heracleum sosnowskyi]
MNAVQLQPHSLHFLILVIFLLCITTSSSGSQCVEEDRKALLVFKQGAGSRFPDDLESWNNEEEDCCEWSRVGCDNHTGHVTHLYLSSHFYFRTESELPNVDCLFHLPYLTYLDLSRNTLSGSTVAKFIGSLTKLEYLDLSNAHIFSPFPNHTGNGSNLQYLNLGNSYFGDPVPLPKFIRSLNSLTYLDLSYNGFTGVIPHELGNLSKLQYLNLSVNQLSGVLPQSISNLSHLKAADFSFNNFVGNLDILLSRPYLLLQKLLVSNNRLTGLVPDFTLLPSLKEIRVNSNQLNGYLPTAFQHHSSLQFLSLSNNHLRGSLPDFEGFSSLKVLYLDNNNFSGIVPHFTGCSSLQVLRLNKNQLAKWETQSIGLLTSLRELDLSMNYIRSTISEANLYNLSSLKYMRTSYNPLTFDISSEWLPPFQLQELSSTSCNLGPKFPNWIRNQEYIDHLDISNCQISDTIPIWFANLSSVLQHLNLSSNKIRGKFLFEFPYMQQMDLSSNCFDGPLPQVPPECSRINLSQNKFSGTLHSLSLVKDLPLRFLDVSHNQLIGALPNNWMHFQGLVFLNLGHNKFSGGIPTSIGHLTSLEVIILRNNKLHGELPASLKNCNSLGFADFGLNKLLGEIPSWIGDDLPALYALILKSNRFYGSMPDELCKLSNLHFLDLSMNRISGTIPPCFGNFTVMIERGTEVAQHYCSTSYNWIHKNYISYDTLLRNKIPRQPQHPDPLPVPIPTYSYIDNVLARWKGQEFEYGRNFAYLKMIGLSTNELTGKLSLGITRLLELKGLKLLECLDLSANKFSGKIPSSMSGLHFVAYLNISNNNFWGRIPSGTQLQGFAISTYEGNPGLCGKPLKNICRGHELARHIWPSSSEYEDDGDDTEYERWLYVSAVIGFSTSFWGFIGTLVLNRRWRHAYFCFLYNLKEKCYVALAVHIARLQRKF